MGVDGKNSQGAGWAGSHARPAPLSKLVMIHQHVGQQAGRKEQEFPMTALFLLLKFLCFLSVTRSSLWTLSFFVRVSRNEE